VSDCKLKRAMTDDNNVNLWHEMASHDEMIVAY
jgi:hypothetical protein